MKLMELLTAGVQNNDASKQNVIYLELLGGFTIVGLG